MKNLLLMALVATVLGGCLSDDGQQYVWSRKGRTTKQADRQIKACRKQIASQSISESKRPAMFRKCMSSNGYRFGVPQRAISN